MGALHAHRGGSNAFSRIGAFLPMAQWTAALATRSSTPAVWLALGDSLPEGQGASAKSSRWQDLLHSQMLADYSLVGGEGYKQAAYGVYAPDSPWGNWLTSSTGTQKLDNTLGSWAGLGTHGVELQTAGATRTYTFTGTGVDLWYVKYASGGSFTWAIDSGTTTTVSTNAASTSTANRVRVTGLTAASHTITVTATSITIVLLGLMVFNGDSAAGIHHYDSGAISARATNFTSLGQAFTDTLNLVAPDLVVVGLGANDAANGTAATFQTNLTSLVGQLQGLTKRPSIALVFPYQYSGGTPQETWANYGTAMQTVATATGCAFVNLTPVMAVADSSGTGNYTTDGHPRDAAQRIMASYTASTLGRLFPSTAAAISGSATVGSVLTATATWNLTPDSSSYQWLRDGAAISGATSSTYTVVAGDVSHALSVTVTAAKSGYPSSPSTSGTKTATSAAISETWTGTDGAAWPAQWTIKSGTGVLSGNQGKLTTPAGSYVVSRADLTGMAAQGDTDFTVQVTGLAAGIEQYAMVNINADTTSTPSSGVTTNSFSVLIAYAATASSSFIRLYQGSTQLGSSVTKTLTGTTKYGVHIKRAAGTLFTRVWDASGAEPATWDIQFSTSGLAVPTPTGIASLVAQTGGPSTAVSFLFDNLSVS